MPQSLNKMYVHLVFSTKGRTDTIPKDHLEDVHAYLACVCNNLESRAICVGGTANHVHILCVLNKNMSLSDLVKKVKSASSKWLNEKNGLLSRFCWQDGYGAFSISQSHVEAVVQYIKNQNEHHQHVSFQEEFRTICRKCGVTFDERYVWN